MAFKTVIDCYLKTRIPPVFKCRVKKNMGYCDRRMVHVRLVDWFNGKERVMVSTLSNGVYSPERSLKIKRRTKSDRAEKLPDILY